MVPPHVHGEQPRNVEKGHDAEVGAAGAEGFFAGSWGGEAEHSSEDERVRDGNEQRVKADHVGGNREDVGVAEGSIPTGELEHGHVLAVRVVHDCRAAERQAENLENGGAHENHGPEQGGQADGSRWGWSGWPGTAEGCRWLRSGQRPRPPAALTPP